MMGLSIRQPWASLIALGAKTIETRSWSTTYRGPLAIHASKSTAGFGRVGTRSTIEGGAHPSMNWQIERDQSGLLLRSSSLAWPYRLPLGAIVAVAHLSAVVEATPANTEHLDERERALGDFTAGRALWLLWNVRPLRSPIECAGRQGLWIVQPDLVARIQEGLR